MANQEQYVYQPIWLMNGNLIIKVFWVVNWPKDGQTDLYLTKMIKKII